MTSLFQHIVQPPFMTTLFQHIVQQWHARRSCKAKFCKADVGFEQLQAPAQAMCSIVPAADTCQGTPQVVLGHGMEAELELDGSTDFVLQAALLRTELVTPGPINCCREMALGVTKLVRLPA